MMEWYQAAGLLIGSVIMFMALGLPVAFAFLAANILGVFIFMGGVGGISQLIANATTSVTTFTLVPVPLFIMMGELFFHTGLARGVFDALDKCIGRLPGRLSFLTIGGGALFATLSGSSIANTAMLGSLMVPEMTRRGYKSHMSIGPILGIGGLAMIIPPSTLAVLLGSIARIDIGALLIAGIVPGLILAALYVALIAVQMKIDPAAAPHYSVDNMPWRAKLSIMMRRILPMGLVIFSVVGLIILGVATPTEASAFGVLSVVVLAGLYRQLSWDALRKSVMGALRVTAMVLLIIVGSSTFSQILAFSGATSGMITWATGLDLSAGLMLVFMLGVLLFFGMFMDQVSMMLITLPVFMPLAASLGFDPVWFGVVILLGLEVSLATPPFGLLLFVMMGVAPPGTTLGQVARAALPYIAGVFLLLVLLALIPGIALLLPRLMG
ncbi:MAG: TRAP transporter large permease subunit [Sphingomonadales bacterium]